MVEVKISNEIPPIYERLKQLFNVEWDNGLVIAYGDTVYCKFSIDDALMVHESTHIRQQAEYPGGVEAWWERYLTDAKFRLDQEIEAYRAQAKHIRTYSKNRNAAFGYLHHLYTSLSGPMYGSVVSYEQAKLLIG